MDPQGDARQGLQLDTGFRCWGKLTTDPSTARPKWRLYGPALSGHLLYSLVNHACANRYYHYLVR